MRVLILHDEVAADARADELDVLVQCRSIAGALTAHGHRVDTATCGLDLAAAAHAVRAHAPDVVFNLVESIARTGRLIHLAPALLDSLGVRYTGASTDAVFTTSNKLLAKRLLRGAGLPTPDWLALGDRSAFTPGRYIVKSVWEHGSLGLDAASIVDASSAAELASTIETRAPELGRDAFAERYVDGREFNLSLLARDGDAEVLPPAEIEFVDWDAHKPRIVDWRAKWDAGSREYHDTPRRFEFAAGDRGLLDRLTGLAHRCWGLFGLRGWARVDFRVDGAGEPWILEVNTNPCLAPDAGFAAAVARAELELGDALERILADASAVAR